MLFIAETFFTKSGHEELSAFTKDGFVWTNCTLCHVAKGNDHQDTYVTVFGFTGHKSPHT